MNYPPCPSRQRLTLWGSDGSKLYGQRCTEQDSEKANQDVSPADCDSCPLRSLLVRAVAKPRVGVVKPDTSKDIVSCLHRKQTEVKSGCGSCSLKSRMVKFCDLDKSTHYGGIVTKAICEACPVREP